jgi:hypothetical protein
LWKGASYQVSELRLIHGINHAEEFGTPQSLALLFNRLMPYEQAGIVPGVRAWKGLSLLYLYLWHFAVSPHQLQKHPGTSHAQMTREFSTASRASLSTVRIMIGEDQVSPWWEAISGSRSSSLRWLLCSFQNPRRGSKNDSVTCNKLSPILASF